MDILSFFRKFSLPCSLVLGAVGYLIFANVPFLESLGDAVGPKLVDLMPVVLFSLLYVTFCKIEIKEMKPKTWHFILQLIRTSLALMKLVPIISGVIVGYVIAICMGEVDFSGVAAASWFSCPVSFDTITHFSWAPFLYMLPVAIAPVLEHIGDVYVVSAVAKKDFVADPGLHRTMLGDGVACLCSAFLGGPPETTYSEVTGAMSITKVTSPAVIRISAATAICFSIVGKLSALLQSIPQAVLGGIMLLLFGTIASVGVQNLMQNKVDMNETRNVIIISVMLTMGLGGAVLSSGSFAISGIGLSAVIGVILNLVLPKTKKEEA